MRNATFAIGFFASTALVVPTAWHGVDATVERDGKHVRPLQRELELDGARVTLDVDHNLIMTGDSVIAKLRAYSDTPKQVAVDLVVLHSNDVMGSRVSQPPTTIDREHLTLEATPDGGKLLESKLVLGSRSTKSMIDSFRVVVVPRGSDELDVDGDSTIAAIGVTGWSKNDFALAIEPEGTPNAGEPFTVAVRIKNTMRHPMARRPFVHLGTNIGLYGLAADNFEIEEQSEQDDGAADAPLAPGETMVAHFMVTPTGEEPVREVTLIANAMTYGEEGVGATAGAMDAETVALAPAPSPDSPAPSVAAQ